MTVLNLITDILQTIAIFFLLLANFKHSEAIINLSTIIGTKKIVGNAKYGKTYPWRGDAISKYPPELLNDDE